MKKLFTVVALAGLMASCNNKKDEKTETTTSDTAVTTTPPPVTEPTTAPVTSGETPKFSDPDVQAYADSYAALVEGYKKAAESKDMSKLADLSKMGQDLSAKAAAMSQKLTNPDDAKKLGDFITAKTNEIAEYVKKLSGQ